MNELGASTKRPDAFSKGSFAACARQASPIESTSLVQIGVPRFVGSRAPYHHPSVGTSALSVLEGSEAGAEPRGWARWWDGIGWSGIARDSVPGMRLEGWDVSG